MSRMSNFRGQWTQAPVMYNSEFETPEDGQYRVVIEEVKYSEVDKDNNPTDPTYIYILRVKEGNGAGMRFRKFQTIRTEKNLSFLKGDIMRLGIVVPGDPEDIILALQRAKGLTVDVTVKSREYNGKTYKDCTFDRLIKDGAASDPSNNPFVQDGRTSKTYQQRQQPNNQDMPPFDGGYYDNVPY